MAVVRKKQDDKFLIALRELVTSGGSGSNRQCFDCGQKGPTYVNMKIGSFVCTRCSGVLRGLTPPHRVKSISMATFTQEEIDFLKAHGNELCAKTWLGLWDPKRAVHQDHRELMIEKYERKRYYLEPASPLKSLPNAVNLKSASASVPNGSTSLQHNGYSSSNNSNNNSSNSNGYASIHLTPPAAQRTAASGLTAASSSKGGSTTASTAISRPHHHHDAFNLSGGLSLNSAGSTSTGALSDTSSCASNGFAGDTDFVADFGTANIFDATSACSAGSPAVSSASSSVSCSSTNGYAKVQPIRAAHLLQQQLQQHQQSLLNGNGRGAESENFADFEHAPIYNASGTPLQNGHKSMSAHHVNNKAPSEDRYAALKDLDEQLREMKAIEAVPQSTEPQRMPTNNGNVTDIYGQAIHNNNHVNPFSQQTQQQQPPKIIANPFQANNNNTNPPQQQNLYGQVTLIPNGFANSLPQQQSVGVVPPHLANFYNLNGNGNGFGLPGAQVPNGCGFGIMQPPAVMAGGVSVGLNGGGASYSNPFAANGGAMKSNNPFL